MRSNNNQARRVAHRPRCDRFAVLPLAQLVAEGKDLMHLPIAVLCRRCGEVGRLQVHPPMPTWSCSTWMMQQGNGRGFNVSALLREMS